MLASSSPSSARAGLLILFMWGRRMDRSKRLTCNIVHVRLFLGPQQGMPDGWVSFAKHRHAGWSHYWSRNVLLYGPSQWLQLDQNGHFRSQEYCFQIPMGNFHYIVMALGFKNASVIYPCAMIVIFHATLHDCLDDYVDDMFVKSKEVCHHIYNVMEVFTRCKKYNRRMKPLKCDFVSLQENYYDSLPIGRNLLELPKLKLSMYGASQNLQTVKKLLRKGLLRA